MSKIKLDPENTRLHNQQNKESINKSLKELKAGRSILIDNEDYVIAGNGVFEQAKELGIKIKVIESDGTELIVVKRTDLNYKDKNRRQLAIADNATGETSEWNFEELTEDEIQEWNIEVPEDEEEVLEAEEDDFDTTPPENPLTVLGDLYEIGEHRLLCGDSTDSDQVAKLMNGEKADIIWTDPPYGINEEGDRSKRGGLAKGNNLPSFKDDTIQYAIDAFNQSINKDIKIQIWFGANYYCHSLPQSPNWLVWDKRVEENQRDYNSDCEIAWVQSNFNSIRIFRHLWKGMLKDSERGEKRVHATQKPIALVEYCINEYDKDAKIILDYFGGSGVCMVTSHQLNKKCLTMELEPKYCDVIVSRMIELDNSLTVFRNGKDETIKWKK